MTLRDLPPDDGPELLPPAELLRLRAELARPPGPKVRAQHLAATVMAARQRGHNHMGRFASRSARAGVAVLAALAITSGLAGAQLLPDQAQRLLSNVSDRFAPTESGPPAEPATPADTTTTERSAPSRTSPAHDPAPGTVSAAPPPTTEELVVGGPPATTTSTAPPARPAPSTTIPGPAGPGSPDDPTDPVPTTTTTVPPTTTTTVPPTTTTTSPPTTTTTTSPVGGERR